MSWYKNYITDSDSTRIDHSSGGYELWENGKLVFVQYNTGDKLHFSFQDDEYQVIKIETHDGIIWNK